MTETLKSAAAQIAGWSTRPPALPDSVRHVALRALIDTVGVSLGGGEEPAPQMLASRTVRQAAEGPSTLMTRDGRTVPASAAFVNGTAAHALDFDDVSGAYDGHPSCPVLPAAVAAAEARGASGEDLLVAYALGIETASAVGAALGRENYSRGFHTTSVVGAIGAAVAAGLIYELGETALQRALGIAASYASGLKKNFGTMTKPLHSGLAARAGVEAAELAADGFTADEDVFSGKIGMLAVFGASERLADLLPDDGTGREWLVVAPGISLKKYPCCYMLARALDGVLALKEEGLNPEQVRGVEVVVQPGGVSAVIHDRPKTGLEGKFSVPYTVAAALVDGEIKLATFTEDAVMRPEVRSLMDRIEYREAPDPDDEGGKGFSVVERGYARVRIFTRSGEEREVFVRTPRGAPGEPFTREEVDAKFLDAAGSAIGRDGASALLDRLWRLSEIRDVTEVFRDIV
jgi:2-methylcitrate dehydratase PrpD